MSENTPELSGGEVSQPLASNPEPTKNETVISNADKFKDKLASLRGQKPSNDGKPLTEVSTEKKVETNVVGDKVTEAENKNVKPKQEKPKHDSQGRINGLVRNIHDRDARIHDRDVRIKQLESELSKYNGQKKTRDEFSNDAEYIADISSNKAEEIAIKREYARETQQREQEEIQVYREKVAMQVERPEIFHERAKKYAEHIDPITEDYVVNSDIGFKMLDLIMHKFETEKGAYEEYAKMPTAKKNILLVNLEQQLANKAPSGNKPNNAESVISKAPQSITPTKGEKLSEPTDIQSRFKAKLNNIRAGYRPN